MLALITAILGAPAAIEALLARITALEALVAQIKTNQAIADVQQTQKDTAAAVSDADYAKASADNAANLGKL